MPQNNIRKFRLEQSLTLTELAAITVPPIGAPPMSASLLSKLELGQRTLSPEWRQALAAALNVYPTELEPAD